MAVNRGKAFEQKVKEDWKKTFPDSVIIRLPDQMSGYKGSSANVSDFIGFNQTKLFLLEAKTTQINTFPLTNLRQYNDLLAYKNITNVYPGVILWFIKHDKIIFVPINSIEKMKKDGKKSINVKMLDENVYYMVEIPSKKKKVFLDSDYSILMNIKEE